MTGKVSQIRVAEAEITMDDGRVIVVGLGNPILGDIRRRFGGIDTPAAIVERASWGEQRSVYSRLADLAATTFAKLVVTGGHSAGFEDQFYVYAHDNSELEPLGEYLAHTIPARVRPLGDDQPVPGSLGRAGDPRPPVAAS